MQKSQLKRLIDTGHYRPEPGEVAVAMLRRRGVRELLTGGVEAASNGKLDGAAKLDGAGHVDGAGNLPLNPADRIQSPSAVPRQAA